MISEVEGKYLKGMPYLGYLVSLRFLQIMITLLSESFTNTRIYIITREKKPPPNTPPLPPP